MLKNIRRKAAMLGAAALIVATAGPAMAADAHAEADAQAIKGSGDLLGQIFGPVLDGGTCTAVYPGTPNGAPADKCGDNLTLGGPTSVGYTQEAAGNANAQSGATATVLPVELPGLGESVDLTNIIQGLGASNSSQVLNAVVGLVVQLLNTLGQAGLNDLYTAIDTALNGVLNALTGVIDITARLGAVEATCTAQPNTAQGNGSVAGIDIVIDLGGGAQQIIVPIPVASDPNTPLLVSVPDLVDDILLGINATLNQSLNGALAGLGNLTETVRTAVVKPIMDALTPALQALANALEPLLEGTVNEQVNGAGDHPQGQSPADDGEITTTALDVQLLQGTPLSGQLELAKVHCGPNTAGDNVGPPTDECDDDPGTDLKLDKKEKVKGDNKVKYTIEVYNTCPTPSAADTFVKDFFSNDIDTDDIKKVDVSQGSFDKDSGVWKVGSIAAKSKATLEFEVKVKKGDLDDGIKNSACVNQSSKPDKIQKNKGLSKDTDGCDTVKSQKDKTPKVVDSGLNDGGNLGPLGATGLLAVSALVGAATRQRLLLDR